MRARTHRCPRRTEHDRGRIFESGDAGSKADKMALGGVTFSVQFP